MERSPANRLQYNDSSGFQISTGRSSAAEKTAGQSRASRRSTGSKPSIAGRGGMYASDMNIQILDPVLGRKNHRYELRSSDGEDDAGQAVPAKVDEDGFQVLEETPQILTTTTSSNKRKLQRHRPEKGSPRVLRPLRQENKLRSKLILGQSGSPQGKGPEKRLAGNEDKGSKRELAEYDQEQRALRDSLQKSIKRLGKVSRRMNIDPQCLQPQAQPSAPK